MSQGQKTIGGFRISRDPFSLTNSYTGNMDNIEAQIDMVEDKQMVTASVPSVQFDDQPSIVQTDAQDPTQLPSYQLTEQQLPPNQLQQQPPSHQPQTVSVQDVKSPIVDQFQDLRLGDQTITKPVTKIGEKKPFEGLTIVISGIVNPQRSDLRNKAIALGARYSPDWTNEATHLICPFQNTPKLSQMLSSGHGIAVKPQFIYDCFNAETRLSEDSYLLFPINQPSVASSGSSDMTDSDDGIDTDDEAMSSS
jgi:hypothetical protein